MNKATVFVFATDAEARPLLDTFDGARVSGTTLTLYGVDDALVMICGRGLAVAGAAIDVLAAEVRPRRVVLGGIAQRLHDGLPLGGIAQIGAATLDRPHRTTYVPVSRLTQTDMAGVHGDCTLLSRATPLPGAAERARIAVFADLLDREGAAVASACVQHGIECAIFKTVGEYVGERALSAGMTIELNTRLAAFLLGHYGWLTHGVEQGETRLVSVGRAV